MSLKQAKQRFKKTRIGRGLRHIRNFFWRSTLENARWRKEDPISYHVFHDRMSFD